MSESSSTSIELSGTVNSNAEWSIVLVGDYVYQDGIVSEPVGSELQKRIDESDLALVNLEAPVPVDRGPIDKIGPAKESSQFAPQTLASAGFDVACLANNHIMDFGPEGLRATQQACADAGIETVGAGETIDEALSPLCMPIDSDSNDDTNNNSNDDNDCTLAVINVCEQEFGIADDGPGTGWVSHPTVKRRIRRANETANIVLVVAHGGIEYVPFPPLGRQQTLRSFVDSGADAVIGHHPHVAQGWEVYNGCPIVYSLGNFFFKQPLHPSTIWGLAVTLSGHRSTITGVTIVLTDQRDGRVHEMDDPASHLGYLRRVSDITGDRDALRAHWQELAVRVFEQRYSEWLRIATAAGPMRFLGKPYASLGTETWDPTERRTEMLTLLNIVRNESHREVIETALGVRAGNITDKRTPEVHQTVRNLLAWTEDRPVYNRDQRGISNRMIQILLEKLT